MPEFGVIGDQYGTELPEIKIDQRQLDNEKKAARFSKTEEFQRLKQHLEERIKFYQTCMPSGEDVHLSGLVMEEVGRKWMLANTIVAEFKAVLMFYENARAVVEEQNGPPTL